MTRAMARAMARLRAQLVRMHPEVEVRLLLMSDVDIIDQMVSAAEGMTQPQLEAWRRRVEAIYMDARREASS